MLCWWVFVGTCLCPWVRSMLSNCTTLIVLDYVQVFVFVCRRKTAYYFHQSNFYPTYQHYKKISPILTSCHWIISISLTEFRFFSTLRAMFKHFELRRDSHEPSCLIILDLFLFKIFANCVENSSETYFAFWSCVSVTTLLFFTLLLLAMDFFSLFELASLIFFSRFFLDGASKSKAMSKSLSSRYEVTAGRLRFRGATKSSSSSDMSLKNNHIQF